MNELERELELSLDETLARRAQRNELIIAGIRAIALTIVAVLGTRLMGPRTLWISLAWTTCAWVIVLAERHRAYRRSVPFAATAIDAASIASLTLTIGYGLPVHLAATALVSTLLAITGAIRPQRWWIAVTTTLAAANMMLASRAAALSYSEALMLCLLIVVAGMLGSWLARISRRAFESEVHRVIAGRFVSSQILDAGSRSSLRRLTEARAVDGTVLVSDIRAFTSYAETRAPAEVLEFLNQVQGTFAAIVLANGGTVDKFMGDGMLAVFGVRDALEDHAARAIAAARDIVRAAETLNVRIGVGVHSGRVIAGVLGSGSRLELTVIGDTVNIAARLESLTKEKNVASLISAAAVERACVEPNSIVPLGPARLRGRTQEVVVYTLAA